MTRLNDWQWHGGNSGPYLHLAAANGFAPQAYRSFVESLGDEFRVVSAPFAPLEPGRDPHQLTTWQSLADELADHLRGAGAEQILGVGHSVGAVITLLAAVREPNLFGALVLFDPVIFCGFRAWAWGWMQRLGQTHRLPLVSRAARRRDHWPSREVLRHEYQKKDFFTRWAPGVLDDYLDSGLVVEKNGVALRFAPAWEARIFATAPHNLWPLIRQVRVPVMIVRGAESDAFLPAAATRFAKTVPHARCEVLPEISHLVPMEAPESSAALVRDFVRMLDR